MNCDDYLSMLATSPVEELTRGRAREHAVGCRGCDRATHMVAEYEHAAQMAFGDIYSTVPVAQTAMTAFAAARRRTVARNYSVGLGIAAVATVFFMVASRNSLPIVSRSMVRETFRLQCLSPAQAAEVVRPYVQPTGTIRIRPNEPLGLIEVAASPQRMATVRSVLDRYDSPAESQCAVQVIVPKVP
ncbi:MAG: secretin N-terminal domain-containing protein [bacterium]